MTVPPLCFSWLPLLFLFFAYDKQRYDRRLQSTGPVLPWNVVEVSDRIPVYRRSVT